MNTTFPPPFNISPEGARVREPVATLQAFTLRPSGLMKSAIKKSHSIATRYNFQSGTVKLHHFATLFS
jgi:hypothetical protein